LRFCPGTFFAGVLAVGRGVFDLGIHLGADQDDQP
jgi:hypothetical protein